MKIVSEPKVPTDIPITDLPHGELAEITQALPAHHVGKIVQRSEDNLIELGCPAMWCCSITLLAFRVRILPKGTTLEV